MYINRPWTWMTFWKCSVVYPFTPHLMQAIAAKLQYLGHNILCFPVRLNPIDKLESVIMKVLFSDTKFYNGEIWRFCHGYNSCVWAYQQVSELQAGFVPGVDSFRVSLHSPNQAFVGSLGLCKVTVWGIWKNGGNSHLSLFIHWNIPISPDRWGVRNIYLDKPTI